MPLNYFPLINIAYRLNCQDKFGLLSINIWTILAYALSMNLNAFLKTFGKRIRAIRKSKNISQEKLAELAGLHPTYISDVERGKVNASIYSCYMITVALDVPLSELIAFYKGDEEIENELAVLNGLIRQLDKKKQQLILSALHGMLSAIEKT